MIKAGLKVVSTVLLLDEISYAMGRYPDYGFSKGTPRRGGHGMYEHTLWRMELGGPGDPLFGLYGLSRVLEGLDVELADRARALVGRGCEVGLGMTQEFLDGEEGSDGLNFSLGAVAWLARAGAGIDIDQLVLRARLDE